MVTIEGKNLCIRGKRYEQGPCMNIIEHFGEEAIAGSRLPVNLVEMSRQRFGLLHDLSFARVSHLQGGGCIAGAEAYASFIKLGSA